MNNNVPQWIISQREQIIRRVERAESHSILWLQSSITKHDITCSINPLKNQINYTKPIDFVKDFECAICLNSSESHKYCKVSCSHKFHFHCINQWIKTKIDNQSTITCPNCRDELKKIKN